MGVQLSREGETLRILGIVAEYDPFHNGHLYHLTEARRLVQPDFCLIVMSTWFKQRGELAFLPPEGRAACAICTGADAVFALPASWTLRDAEHYALGAVQTLGRLGITHLAFGAETNDLTLLQKLAALTESPAVAEKLKEGLAQGLGFPAALARAASQQLAGSETILRSPNNVLALCYLRAIRRLKLPIAPVLIPRRGSYHASVIDPAFPSASAIRSHAEKGNWSAALSALPPSAARLLRQNALEGQLPRKNVTDALLIHRLRSLTPAEAASLPFLSEGLEFRLLHAAGECLSRENLLRLCSCKRYPAARISRLCAWALLPPPTEGELSALPDDFLLLGLRQNKTMTSLWRARQLKIFTSLAGRGQAPFWRLDLAAAKLFALATCRMGDYPLTEKLFTMRE